MKKYIVLSVNDNPDYLYFTPLTCWTWKKLGWEPIVMYHGKENEIYDLALCETEYENVVHVGPIEGYRSDTITQVSRLYAECKQTDGYLMTGDIDMIPLSDYWKFNESSATVWGHDLTDYGHYPCCYIGMPAKLWRKVMQIKSDQIEVHIKSALDTLPQAKNPDFYKYWFTDQDLITERLKPYNTVHVKRGRYASGLAIGRVDRAAWSLSHSTFIDAHLHHQIYHKGNEWKFEQTMELLHAIWPEEDFGWFESYHYEFKRLTGHA